MHKNYIWDPVSTATANLWLFFFCSVLLLFHISLCASFCAALQVQSHRSSVAPYCRIQIPNWQPACKKLTNSRSPWRRFVSGASSFCFRSCSNTGAHGLQEERGQTTCAELAGGKLIIVKHVHPWPFQTVSSLPAFLLWAETPATRQGRTGRRLHWSSPSD